MRIEVGDEEQPQGRSVDTLGELLLRSGFRLALYGRLGNGSMEAAVSFALRMVDTNSRLPVFVRSSTFGGDIETWLQTEMELRYELDRDTAASVVHLAFPIVDLTTAGSGDVEVLFRALAEWQPGFLVVSSAPSAPAAALIVRVLDLEASEAYRLVSEVAERPESEVLESAASAGLGPPRNPFEVVIMADWLAAERRAVTKNETSAPSLMAMWADQIIEAAALPAATGVYLAYIARWLGVNCQSAIRPTDILPSSNTVRKWSLRVLAALAVLGGLIGLAVGGWDGLVAGSLFTPLLVAHSIHPHSHGQPGEVDTRRGWATVRRNAAGVAAGHLAFGAVIGVLAGTFWFVVSLIRAAGPWAPLTVEWLAGQVWKPMLIPPVFGAAAALLFYVDGILAFAFWNAFQKLRNARAGLAPLGFADFLEDSARAGFLERDGANYRFANGLLEAYFADLGRDDKQPEVVHPGFWYDPQVQRTSDRAESRG